MRSPIGSPLCWMVRSDSGRADVAVAEDRREQLDRLRVGVVQVLGRVAQQAAAVGRVVERAAGSPRPRRAGSRPGSRRSRASIVAWESRPSRILVCCRSRGRRYADARPLGEPDFTERKYGWRSAARRLRRCWALHLGRSHAHDLIHHDRTTGRSGRQRPGFWPVLLCWVAVALEGFDLVVIGAVIPTLSKTGDLGFTDSSLTMASTVGPGRRRHRRRGGRARSPTGSAAG